MTLEEIKQFFEQNKDNEEVKNYLAGLSKPTPEGVTAFLDTAEGKKLLQPRLDQHFTKGLETWKEKTLPSLLDEEIKKKFPGETEEQKRLRKLEEELAKERQARVKSELINKATTLATQKGLPVELVSYFVGQDEESTTNNLTALENIWQQHLEKAVAEKFKDNGRSPNAGSGAPKSTIEQLQEQLKTATRLDERIGIQNKIFELQKQKKE
jgi:transposase